MIKIRCVVEAWEKILPATVYGMEKSWDYVAKECIRYLLFEKESI